MQAGSRRGLEKTRRRVVAPVATIAGLLAACLPASLVTAAEPLDGLPPSVTTVLDRRAVPADTLSVYVADVDSGETVLAWEADTPRNPASTMKVVTTLVALDLLGPSYRWKTDVYALGEIEAGRLDGDLLIKGYGDPYLVTERVWQMLRALAQTGLRDIGGDIVLDDSFFAVPPHDPAAFDSQPLRAYNVAPNALMMNFKVVRYWFEPDRAAGSVRVQLDPPLENLLVENRLSLADASCRGYQRGISMTANETYDRIVLDGRFPSRCRRYAMDRTALSHNEFAYGLVSALWKESGGTIGGGWRSGVAEEDAEPVLSFASLPLAEIIARVNKHSNNVMARQLLYTLAAEIDGPPGTEASGRRIVGEWLDERLPGIGDVRLDNGAGLSREARITARDFGAILDYAWRQTYMPEFTASLALSGHDGTLRRRFGDSALVGRAHLKTGSLDHVAAIAGYLQARSGRRFSVVMLHNHEDIHRGYGTEVQTALLRWLNTL